MIYHLTTCDAWEHAQQTGEYLAESLASQGFIHFSTAQQVAKVANAIYAGRQDLMLLTVDSTRLSAPLRYESPDGAIPAAHDSGELFPHLYGALNLDAVVAVRAFLPDADGQFTF